MTVDQKKTSGKHKVKRFKPKNFDEDYGNLIKNRVNKVNECLLYKGLLTKGRPRVFRNGKNQHLTRYLFSNLKKINLSEKDVIMHTCDNPSCINIDHLKLGTQKDNVLDMCNKKRHYMHNTNKCKNGHDFDKIRKNGQRDCSICHNNYMKKYRNNE